MHNSLYIITYTDTDTKEKIEHEECNSSTAIEIYNTLQQQDDVENLILLEYDLITKKYYLMEV